MKDVLELLKEQEKTNGINLLSLKAGTKIIVKTNNSTYELEKIDEDNKITISGGYFGEVKTNGYFIGSTWGGSLIKPRWIGYQMHMEINTEKGCITTSPVNYAKITGNEWEWEMEWENKLEE